MDFTIDDDQQSLRAAAAELASRHQPPGGQGDQPVGPGRHDQDTWRALADLGALGLPFTEEDGGLGASPVEVILVAAELGRAGVLTAYAEALVAAALLAQSDSGAAKELLAKLIEGSELVIPALSEPGRTWSLGSTVKAEQNAGDWVLSGAKEPVPYAENADVILVPATSADGLGVFAVPPADMASPGRVELNGSKAQLVIAPGAGESALQCAVNLGLVALAGESLGAIEAATELTVEYLKTRKQFGVALMNFQTLSHRAADMYVSQELARSMAYYLAMAIGADPGDTDAASRSKVLLGQAGRHIAQEAIQLHGGIAMTAEYAVGQRAARLTAIEHTFGDSHQHLSALAGRIDDHEMIDLLG